jgi:hypothetical protein
MYLWDQAIKDANFATVVYQQIGQMGAYETCAPGNQHTRHALVPELGAIRKRCGAAIQICRAESRASSSTYLTAATSKRFHADTAACHSRN